MTEETAGTEEALAPRVGPLRPGLVVLVAFFVIGFMLYGISLNAPPQFDDIHVLNELEAGIFWQINRPPRRALSAASLILSHKMHGTEVFGYHLVNVLLHVLAATGIYALGMQLFRGDRARAGAIAAGVVFLVHPLATQAVTYMCQRYTCMTAMFVIWSLVAYARARKAACLSAQTGGSFPVGWLALSLTFTVAAMFCKEFAVAIPFIVVAMEILFFRDGTPWKRRLACLAPVLATVVIVPVVYMGFTTDVGVHSDPKGFLPLPDWGGGRIPRLVYLLTQWKVILGVYFRLMAVPWGQSIDHGFVPVHELSVGVVAAGLVLTAIFVGGLCLWRRAPVVTLGILIIFLGLGPTSTFVPNTEFVAEHRAYLSIGGFALVMGWLIASLPGRSWIVVLALYGSTLSVLTINRNRLWNDDLLLWQDAVEKAPAIPRPAYAVGNIFLRLGDPAKAEAYYRKALAIRPTYVPALNNLGVSLEGQGRYRDALLAYRDVVLHEPGNLDTIYNMGRLFLQLGEVSKARVATEQLLSRAPGHVGGRLTMAQIHERQGQALDAKDCYSRVLQSKASAEQKLVAGVRLGRILEREKSDAAALSAYDQVKSFAPHDAGLKLARGRVLRRLGRWQEAIVELTEGMALASPEKSRAYLLELIRVDVGRGKTEAARKRYHDALTDGLPPDPELTELLGKPSP